jgi:hypothetical protein
MRQIAMIAVFAMFAAASAAAQEAREPCYGNFEPTKNAAEAEETSPAPEGAQLNLTSNQCEAVAKREVRVPLFQVPQDGEDPMALTLGVKNLGGMLRFKVPFSF